MAEFNIRSESVDIERIMRQIRARIREKRGTDYTEEQIRQLATVKLEKFVDPQHVRSDLVEHYRRKRPGPPLTAPPLPALPRDLPQSVPPAEFDRETIYRSSRGVFGQILQVVRRVLNPVLKLFFNPNPLIHALVRQNEITVRQAEQVEWIVQMLQRHLEFLERIARHFDQVGAKFAVREELDALNYEVLNNLVVEMTRLAVDMKNQKMRLESIASRLDFDERRARALESVVQYRSSTAPLTGESAEVREPAEEGGEDAGTTAAPGGEGRRRRRRRRGRRRPAAPAAPESAAGPQTSEPAEAEGAPPEPGDEPDRSEP